MFNKFIDKMLLIDVIKIMLVCFATIITINSCSISHDISKMNEKLDILIK